MQICLGFLRVSQVAQGWLQQHQEVEHGRVPEESSGEAAIIFTF